MNSYLSIGRFSPSKACQPIEHHAHKNRMEIHYLHRGSQIYSIKGRIYKLTGGDVLVTFPDEIHDTANSPQEKSILYWINFQIKNLPGDFLNLPAQEGKALISGLMGIRARRFKGDNELHSIFDKIIAVHHSKSLLKKIMLRALVVSLYVKIIELSCQTALLHTGLIEKVLSNIDKNQAKNIKVEDMIALSGLSRYRFHHRFRKEIGIPPGEYLCRKRIETACRLLKETSTDITSIAYDLNFSTSQYFATCFKKIMNISPKAYREKSKLSC